jgi:hypothetical protein
MTMTTDKDSWQRTGGSSMVRERKGERMSEGEGEGGGKEGGRERKAEREIVDVSDTNWHDRN